MTTLKDFTKLLLPDVVLPKFQKDLVERIDKGEKINFTVYPRKMSLFLGINYDDFLRLIDDRQRQDRDR